MEGEKFVDYLNIKGLCCSAPLRDQLFLESEYSVTVLMSRVRMCSSVHMCYILLPMVNADDLSRSAFPTVPQ